jgi:hypothetical protein
MRFGFLVAVAAALLGIASAPARAGLIGDGTNTVSASYWFPSSSVPPPVCDETSNPNCENEVDSTGNATPTIPATFKQGPIDGATISVGDTQIVITNVLSDTPFCSATLPCTDVFNGFAFSFSSGVDITGVTTDSASDFRPIAGGLTFGPTEIFVNVVGETPKPGGKLILDVSFTPVGPPVPEPSTWALMLLGFAGLGFAGWRRMAAQTT